jgi:SAM-dependent methyltransferase
LTGESRLDIRRDPSPLGELDFLIASEVFEHVEPPVEQAFANAARFLKPSGVLLLTVPWVWDGDRSAAIPELHDWRLEREESGFSILNRRPDGQVERFRDMAFDGSPGPSLGRTREHFPELYDWRLSDAAEQPRLLNTRRDRGVETFCNLAFHEGPGLVLEMRLFTKGRNRRQHAVCRFPRDRIRDAGLPRIRHHLRVSLGPPSHDAQTAEGTGPLVMRRPPKEHGGEDDGGQRADGQARGALRATGELQVYVAWA